MRGIEVASSVLLLWSASILFHLLHTRPARPNSLSHPGDCVWSKAPCKHLGSHSRCPTRPTPLVLKAVQLARRHDGLRSLSLSSSIRWHRRTDSLSTFRPYRVWAVPAGLAQRSTPSRRSIHSLDKRLSRPGVGSTSHSRPWRQQHKPISRGLVLPRRSHPVDI